MTDTLVAQKTAATSGVIHLGDVSKVFGKEGMAGSYRAVDHLNLDVAPGQMLALLGKTGCGKSTIFNMIAGLTEPTAGTVRVNGKNPFSEFDAFRGKMAIVFQNDRLLPWRTAIQNVQLGLEMLDTPPPDRKDTARAAMRTTTRISCRVACGSVCRSHAPLRPMPTSCFATNHFLRWTNPPPASCAANSCDW